MYLQEVVINTDATAAIAASLNDPRTQIGDPRNRTYHVALRATEISEAYTLAKHLRQLVDGEVRTNVRYDEQGNPNLIYVAVYNVDALKSLFETVGDLLNPPRRLALETLVLARGPIPDELLERIWRARHESGWKPQRIADRMNERLDEPLFISGMGGFTGRPRRSAPL